MDNGNGRTPARAPGKINPYTLLARAFEVALLVGLLSAGLAFVWPVLFTPQAASPATVQAPGLPGHLLLAQAVSGVVELDLGSGQRKTLFQPPKQGLVTSAVLSPDGSTVVLAYAPPSGAIQFGYTQLYILPADGSAAPTPWVSAGEGSVLYNPAWSPDGKAVYYGQIRTGTVGVPEMKLNRVSYPGGKPETVLENAHSPALSPDGAKIAYVLRDSSTYQENLFVADVDGSHAAPLVSTWKFPLVDAPIFSPNGMTIVFSAPNSGSGSAWPDPATATPWFSEWAGIGTAQAHSVPSDLWSVPAGGGDATRLTHLNDVGFTASFSPDGKRLAFMNSQGIYVMSPDGSALTRITSPVEGGSLQWVP